MKRSKKNAIIFGALLIFIAICILIVVLALKYNKSKEARVTKEFISLIDEKNMIEVEDYKEIKYTVKKQVDGLNTKGFYYVSTPNFDVYLNDNYEVTGFTNRIEKVGVTEVSLEKAKDIAEIYIAELVDGDVILKSYNQENEEKVPYYSFVFTKYKDEYPFYTDQVILNIDKSKGLLDGYSNYSTQGEPSDVIISINVEKAEEIAKDEFSKLNTEPKIVEETTKAYVNDKDMLLCELSYIVTISGKDLQGKETKYKYFITTKDGIIINISKDNVSATTS